MLEMHTHILQIFETRFDCCDDKIYLMKKELKSCTFIGYNIKQTYLLESCLFSIYNVDAQTKVRKISQMSTSNDSGYNDKGDSESLHDIQARSSVSMHGRSDFFLHKYIIINSNSYFQKNLGIRTVLINCTYCLRVTCTSYNEAVNQTYISKCNSNIMSN